MTTAASEGDRPAEFHQGDGVRPIARQRPRIWSSWSGRIGLVGVLSVLAVAFVGPFLGGSPTRSVGIPFSLPAGEQWLGTDLIGRSVLDRVLHGGAQLIVVAAVATATAEVIGISLGLVAGYVGRATDGFVMRALDLLMSFPPILLLLVLAAAAGQGIVTIFVGSVLVNVPGVARVVRSATQELAGSAFVEVAVLRGETTWAVLRREILPNVKGAVLADAGPRLSGTVILVAGLHFLGIGVDPPAPDWGAMVFENRSGLGLQPLAVAAPALLMVLLVLSVNMVADAYARVGQPGGGDPPLA